MAGRRTGKPATSRPSSRWLPRAPAGHRHPHHWCRGWLHCLVRARWPAESRTPIVRRRPGTGLLRQGRNRGHRLGRQRCARTVADFAAWRRHGSPTGAARAAIAPIADRLGLTVEQAALGILAIVNANMMRAIRAVSIERGHDPRPFALMPFGGAGALHAVDLATEIGMRAILIPPSPGILCAEGLVASDLKESFVPTCRTPLASDLTSASGTLADLAEDARRWWKAGALQRETPGSDSLSTCATSARITSLGVSVPARASPVLPTREDLARLSDASTSAAMATTIHRRRSKS